MALNRYETASTNTTHTHTTQPENMVLQVTMGVEPDGEITLISLSRVSGDPAEVEEALRMRPSQQTRNKGFFTPIFLFPVIILITF